MSQASNLSTKDLEANVMDSLSFNFPFHTRILSTEKNGFWQLSHAKALGFTWKVLHEIVDHITNYGFTSSKKPLKMNKPHVECFLKANFYPRTVLPAILRTEPRGLGSSSVVHPRHSLKNLDERSAVASNRPLPPVLVVLE